MSQTVDQLPANPNLEAAKAMLERANALIDAVPKWLRVAAGVFFGLLGPTWMVNDYLKGFGQPGLGAFGDNLIIGILQAAGLVFALLVALIGMILAAPLFTRFFFAHQAKGLGFADHVNSPMLGAAVLAYLFHRIEHALDGRPTLILIDEGWLILEDPVFAGQLREWIKTLRKKNGAVVFATEALLDLDASPVAATILDSCPTRIFLPNARAAEPRSQAIYRKFGLNDRQIEIISRAAPRRDYYCQSRQGHRLFDLGLGEIALAFCAAASKPDQALIDAIDAAPGAAFTRAWLLARGLPWAADLVSHLPLEP